jgi:anti-anti-sigma factor
MLVQESLEGGTRVLQLSGRLDNAAAADADATLSMDAGATQALVLDLSELTYISSAGLRVILKAAKQAQGAKRSFAVAGLQPAVREIFAVTGFDTLIAIHGSRADALGKLA